MGAVGVDETLANREVEDDRGGSTICSMRRRKNKRFVLYVYMCNVWSQPFLLPSTTAVFRGRCSPRLNLRFRGGATQRARGECTARVESKRAGSSASSVPQFRRLT